MELDLKLKSDLEGLLVDGGIQIGDYTISKDGKMIVDNFSDSLEEEVRKLLGLEQDQGEIIIQAEDKEKSVTEDVYEPDKVETPKQAEPVEYTFKGSFDVEVVTSLGLAAQSSAVVDVNLLTSFEMTIIDNDGTKTKFENDSEHTVDLNDMNAVELKYGLIKPNELTIAAGDTYTIDLPEFFSGTVENQPIKVGEVEVATYSIVGKQIIITFNENADNYDDASMHVNLSGSFDTDVFEKVEEVEVEVPYRDGTSYKVTVKAEQQEYTGEDKKTAGKPYVLGEDGTRIDTNRNPTHVDWTVRANDSAEKIGEATIIDDLDDNLEIVEGSFVVERIIRNYKNEEVGREEVTNFTVSYAETGFEIDLGSIDDAYEITYTTRLIRPEGGGPLTINNSARIILGETKTTVTDKVSGTWSGDIPTIKKDGNISEDRKDVIDWVVEYNYGKEDLGIVTLTDTISEGHGEVDLKTIKVYQVDTNIDGNVIGEATLIEVSPEIDEEGNFTIPRLDASGKAYYITFSSTVPVGLNDVTVINTISDDLENPNSDDAKVPVNTIPTGGKVGEQYVDDKGNPSLNFHQNKI